jgi:HD domain.
VSFKPELKIETHIPYLEELLIPWQGIIGDDYPGYKNHVYRMVQFCWALKQTRGEALTEDDKKKIMIAAAFHDIGIWVSNTLDYLDPSIPPAMEYLARQGLNDWKQEIKLMISEHHKLSPYTDAQFDQKKIDIVELFRQGDVIDFSLGMVRFELPKNYIKAMKIAIPNKGFHLGLLKKGMRWFIRHPLNPAPMMKK